MQYEKKHTEYTQINTDKSIHSEMDSVWQNPIQRTVKNCLWLCTASIHDTTQNSSDNLPSYLQTNIIAQMLSIRKEGLIILGLFQDFPGPPPPKTFLQHSIVAQQC